MNKNKHAGAAAALRALDEPQQSYAVAKEKNARHARKTLVRTLEDVEFRARLCAEQKMAEGGMPMQSPAPRWAPRLAELFLDPEHRRSEHLKETLYLVCQELAREFDLPGEDRLYTRALLEETGKDAVPVLADVARDLWHGPKPRSQKRACN